MQMNNRVQSPSMLILPMSLVAGMAPDVLRGLCPRPCDVCKKNQIRRAMAVISREYPLEWSQITRQYGR